MYRVRDFAEERSRTLYVRLPHRIRNTKEVQELFSSGDARVKLPRQASRACHVIFPDLEGKIKGLKELQGKTVDGKRIIALNPRTEPMKDRIRPKKVVVPRPEKTQCKITQTLLVSNINKKTTADDLKRAFPDCESVEMLELNSNGTRSAFVKMESIQTAGEYVRKERELPVVNGNSLSVRCIDARNRKPRSGGLKTKEMKIYDEEGKATGNKFENLNKKQENDDEEDQSEADSDDDSETD